MNFDKGVWLGAFIVHRSGVGMSVPAFGQRLVCFELLACDKGSNTQPFLSA